jgi:hypothetical protein
MQRCISCNGILTKTDTECYVCGEPVPGARKRAKRPQPQAAPARRTVETRKLEARPISPISRLSNLLFVGSLVLTGFAFLSEQKLPIALSLGLSVVLLSMRLFDGRAGTKNASPEALVPHSTTDH